MFLVGRRQCNHRNEGILTDLQPFNWRISSAQLKVICQIITGIIDQPCLIYTFFMFVYLVSLSLTFLINHVWSTHSSCWCICQLITDIVDQPCLIYTFIMLVYLSANHWHCWYQPCLIYTFIMLVYLSAHHWHCWSAMFDLHLHHVISLSAYHWHCWSTMFDLLIYTFILLVYLSAYKSLILLINHVWSTHSSC